MKLAEKEQTQEKIVTNLGLATDEREAVIDRLNTVLADEHLLYVKTRSFHWNVTGFEFVSLHALWEEQYNDLQRIGDEVAERVRMLGGRSLGAMQTFLDKTRLTEVTEETLSARAMVAALLDDHEALINYLRKDIDACSEVYGDEGTADLLTGLIRSHEQMAWMLRSLLEGQPVSG